MDKHQLLSLGGFVLGSYATFHGHRLNKDCWMCQYRGLGWIMALAGLIYNDYCEKQQEKQEPKQTSHRRTTDYYSQNQPFTDFTNRPNTNYSRSESGSDTWETASNGSTETIKGEDNKASQE